MLVILFRTAERWRAGRHWQAGKYKQNSKLTIVQLSKRQVARIGFVSEVAHKVGESKLCF